MTTSSMTEKEIRQIAREEAMAIFEKGIKGVKDELNEVKKLSIQNSKTLAKIERLLLGEFGDSDEALKAKATYAFNHAKKVEESTLLEDSAVALDWFKDMDTPDKGCVDSKLDILGKMIAGYNARKWFGNLLGVVNVATFIGLIIAVMKFLEILEGLGIN